MLYIWQTRAGKLKGPDDAFDEFIGTSVVDISCDQNGNFVLDDDYFTRRDEHTRGKATLKRVSMKCLGRFNSE